MTRIADLLRHAAARCPHGSRARYQGGCRCLPCRAANSRYETERAAARRDGDTRHLVGADRVRRHLKKLSRQGVGYKSVAAAAGVTRTTVARILSGAQQSLRAHHERRILAVDRSAIADKSLVDAGPTWRRLDALIRDGYTKAQIARWCGWKKFAIQLGRGRITARSASRVERVCRMIAAGRLRRER